MALDIPDLVVSSDPPRESNNRVTTPPFSPVPQTPKLGSLIKMKRKRPTEEDDRNEKYRKTGNSTGTRRAEPIMYSFRTVAIPRAQTKAKKTAPYNNRPTFANHSVVAKKRVQDLQSTGSRLPPYQSLFIPVQSHQAPNSSTPTLGTKSDDSETGKTVVRRVFPDSSKSRHFKAAEEYRETDTASKWKSESTKSEGVFFLKIHECWRCVSDLSSRAYFINREDQQADKKSANVRLRRCPSMARPTDGSVSTL